MAEICENGHHTKSSDFTLRQFGILHFLAPCYTDVYIPVEHYQLNFKCIQWFLLNHDIVIIFISCVFWASWALISRCTLLIKTKLKNAAKFSVEKSWQVVLQIVWYSSQRLISQWTLGLQFHYCGIYQQFCMNTDQNSRKLQFSPFETCNVMQQAKIGN